MSLAVSFATVASATPLSLAELHDLGAYLDCTEQCAPLGVSPDYGAYEARSACVSQCGTAPRLWDKDGIEGTTRRDHELALLEYLDVQNANIRLICYDDADETIVKPAALCSGETCERAPSCTASDCAAPEDEALECTAEEVGGARCWWPTTKRAAACPDVVCSAAPVRGLTACRDVDADGIPAWLEAFTGNSDSNPTPTCSRAVACGFRQTCGYDAQLGTGKCSSRSCAGAGACTAFHLELVAEDDQQAIVHVHYDFSPLGARVLDVGIDYDTEQLALIDSRPLAPLKDAGKDLATHHRADGTLRLTVMDVAETAAIPTGPIVELVFQRIASASTQVAFVTDDALQRRAMAPDQGDSQEELADDTLWGPPVVLHARNLTDSNLLLWYSFNDAESPLEYSAVPTAEALCQLIAACANESDEDARAKVLSRLTYLQNGQAVADGIIDGIQAGGAYLSGASEHLRMPVFWQSPMSSNAQDFSFSTWFYTEGNGSDELKTTPQLIYSHNGFGERTRFGIGLRHNSAGSMDLYLFDGDLLSKAPPPAQLSVATNIELRTWHHVGFTLDASSSRITVYLDGREAGTHVFSPSPAAVSCPQFIAKDELAIHEEGDILGGTPPEFVYMAARRNNLYKVERSDLSGSWSEPLIGDGEFSYRDPDYSALLDKIVYSSNASGDYEIWLANGDGNGRRQLTVGFGDTERGIAARRPRWAPDGSGIVFESNAYDILAFDNSFGRVSHLYYIGYDPRNGEVDIRTTAGTEYSQLDYQARVQDQTISDFRLTADAMARQHWNAQWLSGSSSSTGSRGVIVATTSAEGFEGNRIDRLTIPSVINLTARDTLQGLGPSTSEIDLLAAHYSARPGVPEPIITQKIFYRRSMAKFEPAEQFQAVESTEGDATIVSVSHSPNGYSGVCWDRNGDALQDADEDRNQDGTWDEDDCYPSDIGGVWIEYDGTVYTPVIEPPADLVGTKTGPGALLTNGTVNKDIEFVTAFPSGRSFVKLTVSSPLNSKPIPAGEVAKIRFHKANQFVPSVAFAPWKRISASDLAGTELLVKDLTSAIDPTPLQRGGTFEFVEAAAFGPDGDDLLLAAVSRSRPVLLRTHGLSSAANADRIQVTPTRVGGMKWVREDRYYACNWVGGYLHPQKKRIIQAFRGGLDDLKVFSGERDADAFRSEYERGVEQLAAEHRDGEVESQLPSCGNNHAECPPFHLCVASECRMVNCDPGDPQACGAYGGACTQRPVSVEQEHLGPGGSDAFAYVCAADCNTDRQCFSEACLNGPCRFCETPAQVCIECREEVQDLGVLQIAGIAGCPDRRSFFCAGGACRSDCYRTVDGQNVYLCDPATQFCNQGRCDVLGWDWWDLGPASFAGLGTTRHRVPPDPTNAWMGYTQTVDQYVPVEIQAYGVADYTISPEIVVEVKGGPFYGGTWHRLARLVVHNRTRVEAQNHPYTLRAEHVFNDMRVRLVTSPYENLTGAATGIGDTDADFCINDIDVLAAATGGTADYTACYRQAQGSRYTNGYRVGIPMHEAIASCRAFGRAGCPSVSQGEHDFLYGGERAVVLLDAAVDGGSAMNSMTSNKVCSYEGGLQPVDGGVAKKVFYGDVDTERSNQKSAFCAANPAVCSGGQGLIEFDTNTYGYALLNCNVNDPTRSEMAEALFQNIVIVREWPARAGKVTLDTGDLCFVEKTQQLTEPCHSWHGDDVSLDPMSAFIKSGSTLPTQAFEIGITRGFGHMDGYQVVPPPTASLGVTVSGDAPAVGSVSIRNVRDPLTPSTALTLGAHTLASALPVGRTYELALTHAPGAAVRCVIDDGGNSVTSMSGKIASGGVSVLIVCKAGKAINVSTSGLSGSAELLLEVMNGTRVTARERLTVSSNGAASFSALAATGESFLVTLSASPAQQDCGLGSAAGTVGTTAPGVTLTCSDRVASTVSVSVSGLVGNQVVIGDALTGREIAATTNGTATFAGDYFEGDRYGLSILTQPTAPAQRCVFTSGGEGVVGNGGNVNGGSITCTTLPTYFVTVDLTGVLGNGLELTLNETEALSVPRQASGATVTRTFTTELVEGEDYSVKLTGAMDNPKASCLLLDAEGRVGSSGVPLITVICTPVPDELDGYALGGTLIGLTGTGLRLELSGGVEKLDLLPRQNNGTWRFPTLVADNTDYDVEIARQPSNPTEFCSILNASGTVASQDVTDVSVLCQSASVLEGTVVGLRGNGLEIMLVVDSLSYSERRTLRAVKETQWSFVVPDAASFSVIVTQQPNQPRQQCEYQAQTREVRCVTTE